MIQVQWRRGDGHAYGMGVDLDMNGTLDAKAGKWGKKRRRTGEERVHGGLGPGPFLTGCLPQTLPTSLSHPLSLILSLSSSLSHPLSLILSLSSSLSHPLSLFLSPHTHTHTHSPVLPSHTLMVLFLLLFSSYSGRIV
jgi:hypothetical protein